MICYELLEKVIFDEENIKLDLMFFNYSNKLLWNKVIYSVGVFGICIKGKVI